MFARKGNQDTHESKNTLIVNNMEQTNNDSVIPSANDDSFKKAKTDNNDVYPSQSVTTDRKSKLLIQARADRIAWIQAVPLPFSKTVGEPESAFKSSHTLLQVQSASRVLSALYGEGDGMSNEEISKRIEFVLEGVGQNTKEHYELSIPTGHQILQSELSSATGSQEEILRAYRDFLENLQRPESATLVQGMRIFVRNLRDAEHNDVAKSIRSYIDLTVESIKSHNAFKNEPDFDKVRRSLESFVYGQGRNTVWSTIDTSQDEINYHRWQILQFVTPEHLDIPCLAGQSPKELELLLHDSISAIISIDKFFSPYDKLQQILKAYHGINTALTVALNCNGGSTKLPSADDILPTLILTVLRTKPKAIASNLSMISLFSAPGYLRGEAGYAFTNLYGAVQFLLDLNLDEDPKNLNISVEVFRKGLDSSRAAAESMFAIKTNENVNEVKALVLPSTHRAIPINDVRAARLRGEIIDTAWAKQWQSENRRIMSATGESTGSTETSESLPLGFHRSYAFLATRPDQICISDLPQLLAEYRMLVHTTEVLLAERSSRQAEERKRQFAEEQQRLEEKALEMELELELRKNNRSDSSDL